jgi:hypothetical protein
MRRFVWPVAECLEASRPVKAPFDGIGIKVHGPMPIFNLKSCVTRYSAR